jgi:hypothetical protein
MKSRSIQIAVIGVVSVIAFALICRPPTGDGPTPQWVLDEGAVRFPEVMMLRLAAKKILAREFMDGQRSLLSTAALFRDLDQLPPEPPPVPSTDRMTHDIGVPGRTDDERFCRQVIAWLEFPGVPPEQIPAIVERLEVEFWQELDRHGVIRLPDTPAAGTVQELLDRARQELRESTKKVP